VVAGQRYLFLAPDEDPVLLEDPVDFTVEELLRRVAPGREPFRFQIFSSHRPVAIRRKHAGGGRRLGSRRRRAPRPAIGRVCTDSLARSHCSSPVAVSSPVANKGLAPHARSPSALAENVRSRRSALKRQGPWRPPDAPTLLRCILPGQVQ